MRLGEAGEACRCACTWDVSVGADALQAARVAACRAACLRRGVCTWTRCRKGGRREGLKGLVRDAESNGLCFELSEVVELLLEDCGHRASGRNRSVAGGRVHACGGRDPGRWLSAGEDSAPAARCCSRSVRAAGPSRMPSCAHDEAHENKSVRFRACVDPPCGGSVGPSVICRVEG